MGTGFGTIDTIKNIFTFKEESILPKGVTPGASIGPVLQRQRCSINYLKYLLYLELVTIDVFY
jgi:hypothetical protein